VKVARIAARNLWQIQLLCRSFGHNLLVRNNRCCYLTGPFVASQLLKTGIYTTMGKFARVLVLEVEEAKDKNPETPGGKYRRDTPWLVDAFRKKGVESEVLFITSKDTANSLKTTYANTAFLGRVNPMDYPSISLDHYLGILNGLKADGLLLGPDPEHMSLLGAKSILYDLRESSMGSEGVLWHKLDDMKDRGSTEIDRILPPNGPPRVLKMLRGSTGLGVWKLENVGTVDRILMTQAYTQTTEEIPRAELIPRLLSL
jgi:hypothetical protein